nr:hypothetical protein [Candidatus Enterousia merdequi]
SIYTSKEKIIKTWGCPMTGERKNFSEQNYGTLVMRAFNIAGNSVSAFYDSGNKLVFVIDNTINEAKPNVLLVINSESGKKWDEILSVDYDVDLEMIRPKVDNKYQKLDIEYSGLSVYDDLIKAYVTDEDIEDLLEQLDVLRNSAVRHSAMNRLDAANDIISKTNVTIVTTKETIVRLQERIKTLRSKLSATKKEIGKVSTKQSAAKILKLESQIEATNEKLKRAKKRLESAQRRLEAATVDAELASNLLNQPMQKTKQQKTENKSVIVAPKYEIESVVPEEEPQEDNVEPEEYEAEEIEESESDIKPLFEQDPQILDDNIAFKPISFDAPVFDNVSDVKPEQSVPTLNQDIFNESIQEETPILESFTPVVSEPKEQEEEIKPLIDSITPVFSQNDITQEPKVIEDEPIVAPVIAPAPVAPLVEPERPMPVMPVEPIADIKQEITQTTVTSKPNFIYYLLLCVLIVLSVFTLWLYQKNIKPTSPVLTAKAEEVVVEETKDVQPDIVPEEQESVSIEEDITESAFIETEETTEESVAPVVEEKAEEVIETPIQEPEVPEEPDEPVIEDSVPAQVMTSGAFDQEENIVVPEDEIIETKPVYEPGSKYDDMFIDETNEVSSEEPTYDNQEESFYENAFYSAEEAEYQAELEANNN